MNPKYLPLVDALEFLTVFGIGPLLACAIAYAAWSRKPRTFTARQWRLVCVASGVAALLLFAFAKWLDADVRTSQFFLQLAAVLVFGLLWGVFMGAGAAVLLDVLPAAWRFHKRTGLSDNDRSD